MDNPIPVDLGRVAQDLQIRRVQVESVVQLLDECNTVPFITRYRKERTGNLNEVLIREIQLRVQRLRELAERKETILKAIEAQGKLHPDLAAAIRAAENPKRLEDLYLPFKPKKRTKASDARDKGLEPLALRIWNRDEQLTDLAAAAQEFVNAEKGLETPEKVLEGVGHILAEAISEMAAVRDTVRKLVWKTGKIVTTKGEIPEGQGLEYRDYFDYSEPLSQVPPHRVLAINRGDKEGPLKIKIEVSRPELEAAFFHQLPLEGHPQADFFRAAALDALDRLIFPSMEREVRRDLTEAAEKHAVEVFARNLRSLLLQPPIPRQVVLAIDPGLRSGCKVSVLDPQGNLLDHAVIYPHAPQNRRSEAKLLLKDLVGKHKVGVVAIGNGTACRETEELIAEIIAEGIEFSQAGQAPPSSPASMPAGEHEPSPPHGTAPEHDHPAAPAAEQHHPEPALDRSAHVEQHPAHAEHFSAAAEGAPAPDRVPGSPADAAAEGSAHHERETPAPAATRGGEAPQPAPPVAAEPAPPSETPGHHPSDQAPASEEADPEAEAEPELDPHPDHEALDETDETPAEEEVLPPILGGAPEPASPGAPTVSDEAPESGSHETATPPHGHGSEPATAPSHNDGPKPEHPAAGPEVHPDLPPPQQFVVPDEPEDLGEPGEPAPHSELESASPPPSTVAADVDRAALEVERSGEGVGPAALVEGVPADETTPPAGTPETAELSEPVEEPSPTEVRPSDAAAEAPAAPSRGKTGKHEHPRPRGSRPRPPAAPPPTPSPPAPHPADPLLAQLAYVIVNEAGASVYSTSQIGREELPEFDATLRSAISIGRRLQDPLAELVKIEPQNIGVGLYQHDVNPKQLKETLESVISSCVNFVGVDLNTASVPLLRHVSGLNQLTARRIVEYRKEKGAFTNREQLMTVEGIGPATFTQAAGFLKLLDGVNPLDRTWIHPESYQAATALLERFGQTPEVVRNKQEVPELYRRLAESASADLAKELDIGEFTLKDIIEALGRPERDPRDDLPKPIFKKGILKLEDLTAGMELKGTVLNVVDFGAFVDIGLKDSGLVHISQLANRYIKSPHDVVSVGDVVTVWVMSVDQERKRVSLTMVKPGTERQRGGGQQGARRGGPGEPREGQGQGPPRRDRARPPRPSGSALTSPPVGAPPIAALVEPPGRRSERDRGGAPGPHGPGSAPEGGSPGGGPGSGPGGPHAPAGRPGPGSGPGGPGRGGPRGPGGRPGSGGRQDRPAQPRAPSRPSRPSPPPPPLSKEALSGSVPLRSFGQLKQLWEARVEPGPEDETQPAGRPGSAAEHHGSAPAPPAAAAPAPAHAAEPLPSAPPSLPQTEQPPAGETGTS